MLRGGWPPAYPVPWLDTPHTPHLCDLEARQWQAHARPAGKPHIAVLVGEASDAAQHVGDVLSDLVAEDTIHTYPLYTSHTKPSTHTPHSRRLQPEEVEVAQQVIVRGQELEIQLWQRKAAFPGVVDRRYLGLVPQRALRRVQRHGVDGVALVAAALVRRQDKLLCGVDAGREKAGRHSGAALTALRQQQQQRLYEKMSSYCKAQACGRGGAQTTGVVYVLLQQRACSDARPVLPRPLTFPSPRPTPHNPHLEEHGVPRLRVGLRQQSQLTRDEEAQLVHTQRAQLSP
eukprot:364733-Chlamydomonas_euryale.AAC.6